MLILVAEDDQYLLNAYRVKLVRAGFEVAMAMDGEVALETLKTIQPDLILLDLVMPKVDGFAVLESIQKDDRLKTIPVIVASNLGQKEDVERGMALGARDYIIKSEIPINDLIAKINGLISAPVGAVPTPTIQ